MHSNGKRKTSLATACRRDALRRAILEGLLGRLLAMTRSLEQLVINLQCHESTNTWIDESDLDDMLGTRVWPHMRHLELRGIYASECQLVELVYRHRETLQYLALSDITFNDGSWQSFFRTMRMFFSKSLLSRSRFNLAGSLYYREASTMKLYAGT